MSDVCMLEKLAMSERLEATRKLFKKKVLAVDIHSHSTFSDGCSTIAENCQDAKERAKIDFLFCTDHSTIAQKRSLAKFPWAALGQESHSGGYDIGLLLPTKVHEMLDDVVQGIATAREISEYAWIPHPVWFRGITEKALDKVVSDLSPIDQLGIEILNGFRASSRAYPQTGKWGVRLMDRLLEMGRHVTPLGSSDTHYRLEMGNAWTGVFSPKCDAMSIIKAIRAGHCFASESTLIDFTCNGKPMGSTIIANMGDVLRFKIRAADSYGLAWARIVSGGKVIKEYRLREDQVFETELARKAESKPEYFRLETVADDDRRAYSAPIYVKR